MKAKSTYQQFTRIYRKKNKGCYKREVHEHEWFYLKRDERNL